MHDNQWQFGYRRFGPMRVVGMIIGGVAIACVFALAFGWLVMLLWNWLMPMLFGLKAITYWQAFGILLLSKVLFSGMGHGRRGPLRHPLFMHNSHPGWRRHLHDDWVPAGDPRNWVYYREYWNDRGKKDFEEYLNEKGRTPDRGKEGAGDQSQ